MRGLNNRTIHDQTQSVGIGAGNYAVLFLILIQNFVDVISKKFVRYFGRGEDDLSLGIQV